jgi:hypothetical protein
LVSRRGRQYLSCNLQILEIKNNQHMAAATLSRLVIFVRPPTLSATIDFYTSTLNLPLLRHTDKFAELSLTPDSSVKLSIQTTDVEARLSTSYSPFLTFTVEDLPSVVSSMCAKGAHMDGPIKYPAFGKIASVRGPCGHMIGLFEGNTA